MVAVIAVEKHDDVRWVGGKMSEGFQASGAIASLGLMDDFSAVFPGDFGGAVGRAVVGDDDAADRRARDVAQDQGEGVLLVESRNDDVDALRGEGLHGGGRRKGQSLLSQRTQGRVDARYSQRGLFPSFVTGASSSTR